MTSPYLIAYDVSCPRRARRMLNMLKSWRINGQYSVHETLLRPTDVRSLCVDLLGTAHQDDDRLLLARLSSRQAATIYRFGGRGSSVLLGGPLRYQPFPSNWQRGQYLLAYDIRDSRRLQRAYRIVSKHAVALQKSLFLCDGTSSDMRKLISSLCPVLDSREDDLRIYPLLGMDDLWFLAGYKPSLGGLATRPRGILAPIWRLIRGHTYTSR